MDSIVTSPYEESDLFDLCEDEQPPRHAETPNSEIGRQWAEEGVAILPSLFSANEVSTYLTARAANPQWAVTANPYTHSPEIRDLFCHPLLAKALEELLGQPAGLHLNLLGWYSSQRNWHADIYLNPPNVLFSYAAVWIALEKVHPDSGPFQYVPGTHHWPALSQRKVRDAIREAGHDADAPSWPYESEKLLTPLYEKKFAQQGLEPVTYLPELGDVLIWHSNLAHRGSKAADASRSRLAAIGHFSGIGVRPDMPPPLQHGQGGWYFPIG
jgi:hypothetical protein